MKNNFKALLFYPLLIFIVTSLLYSLFLLTSNYTPRMYFYNQKVYPVENIKLENNKKQYEFFSKENYLGILSMKSIGLYIDYNAKDLYFRIKKRGDTKWIHENRYNAFDLVNSFDFPFGFPVQNNSKNTKYIFELELVSNKKSSLNSFNPEINSAILRHYYPKNFFLRKPHEASLFIINKIIQNLGEQSFAYSFMILVLPLVIYYYLFAFYAFNQSGKKYFNDYYKLFKKIYKREDLFLMLPVLVDTGIQKSGLFYLLCTLCIVATIRIKKEKAPVFLLLNSAMLHIVSLLFTLINLRYVANRTSLWSFVFIFIVIAMLTIKLSKRSK